METVTGEAEGPEEQSPAGVPGDGRAAHQKATRTVTRPAQGHGLQGTRTMTGLTQKRNASLRCPRRPKAHSTTNPLFPEALSA